MLNWPPIHSTQTEDSLRHLATEAESRLSGERRGFIYWSEMNVNIQITVLPVSCRVYFIKSCNF